jgi:Ca2+/Na+ antiporter
MIATYLFGVLVGLFGIIYSLVKKNFSRAGILFIYLCVLTGSTLILSLPALHMHGPEPNWTTVGIAWVVNICVLLVFIWYSIKPTKKSNIENNDKL